MKHLRIVLAVAIMAFAAFGFAAAQDATSTPLPPATVVPEATIVPEATAAPDTGSADAPSPFMGIQFEAYDHGVEVTAVLPGSPADAAGFEVGDVVRAIDGVEISEDNVRDVVQGYAVGDTVTVDVMREGLMMTLAVTLGEAPTDNVVIPGRRENLPRFEMFQVERPRLGITIGAGETGVVVNEVEAGSAAEAAGIETGDVITAINDEAVATPQEAVDAVAQAVDDAAVGEFDVTVTVSRGEEELDIVATLVKPETFAIPAIPDLPGLGGRGREGRGFNFGPGMGGFSITPREGEDGAFDLVVPFRPENPEAMTDAAIEALADLGIRVVPREGDDGLFDLYVPTDTLGDLDGGFILPHLEMFRGMMPEGFRFRFDGPMGRNFEFELPDVLIPTVPAPDGEGTA